MTRQEAIKTLQELKRETNDSWYEETYNMAIKALEQEPKRGKWIAIDDIHSQCTECGAIFCITSNDEWEVNYCPNCGAKMEVEEE